MENETAVVDAPAVTEAADETQEPEYDLSVLRTPAEFIEGHPVFRGNRNSFDWFLRSHRAELAAAGAVIAPTKHTYVVPKVFNVVVRRIGQRMAGATVR